MRSHTFPLRFGILLCFLLVPFLTSCGRLGDSTAREAFRKEHPDFELLHSETGEGWDGVAYHHFYYKKPSDDGVYTEFWCFVQQDDGKWKITGRSTPTQTR